MNNIWLNWGDVFTASLQNVWWGFVQFIPKLVVAILFFVVGWILGVLIARAFEHVISALKVDKLLASIGVEQFFAKAGIKLNSGYFIGQVVKWFLIIVFLLPSLNLLGLTDISSFLKDGVLAYLPRVFVAAFILIIATILADALSRTVVAGAKGMGINSANMLGTITRYAIWIFAFIFALGQLGIAQAYMITLFTGIIAMLAIAGGLAFGLGGKEAAGKLIDKLGNEVHRD